MRDEEQMAATESPASAATATLAPEPNENEMPASEPLDLRELQEMTPAALQELFVRFDLRLHPGRTRHQLIVDLVRHVLPRGQQVRTSGWLEQPNDGFAVLRSPRLNFLPLPRMSVSPFNSFVSSASDPDRPSLARFAFRVSARRV
jgi:hypothetical protein